MNLPDVIMRTKSNPEYSWMWNTILFLMQNKSYNTSSKAKFNLQAIEEGLMPREIYVLTAFPGMLPDQNPGVNPE